MKTLLTTLYYFVFPVLLLLAGCFDQRNPKDDLPQRMVTHAKVERGKIILDSDENQRIWSDGAFLEIGETFPPAIETMLKEPTHHYDISPFILDLQTRNKTEWQDAWFDVSRNTREHATASSKSFDVSIPINPLYRDYILFRYPDAHLRIKDQTSPILVLLDDTIRASIMPIKITGDVQ